MCNCNLQTVCTFHILEASLRITLPIEGVRQNESGIVNPDNTEGSSTHWVAYAKRGNRVMYFR